MMSLMVIIEIIQKNTRMPKSVLGDIKSQLRIYTGEKAFIELLKCMEEKI